MESSTETHRCARCKQDKPREAFYKQKEKPSGLHSWCKQCMKERYAERYRNEPKLRRKVAENNKTPRARRYARDWKLQKRYGITLGEYEELLDKQGGICAICGTTDPGGNGGMAVDHCHETGRVRGLLCVNCNRGMGYLRDSVELLQAAIEYLQQSEG